ncbi:hypothetical protein ACIPUC_00635 [Streptomyces sp. LARHCF249]
MIQLQQRWTRTYNQLALRPALGTAELRRELIGLSCGISSHPYWREHGWSMAGRVELRRVAETAPGGVAEVSVRYIDGQFVVSEPGKRSA